MEEPKWYVAHTFSGYENKVASNILTVVENRNLHDLIYEVAIPTETVKELKSKHPFIKSFNYHTFSFLYYYWYLSNFPLFFSIVPKQFLVLTLLLSSLNLIIPLSLNNLYQEN